MSLGDRAGDRERHRDGVLCGGSDVALRRVRDDHAVVGGGVDVDVVDADAGPADDDEVESGPEQRLVDARARPDDQAVDVGDGVVERLALQFVAGLDGVSRLAESLQPGLRDRVGDEHSHIRRIAGLRLTLSVSADSRLRRRAAAVDRAGPGPERLRRPRAHRGVCWSRSTSTGRSLTPR